MFAKVATDITGSPRTAAPALSSRAASRLAVLMEGVFEGKQPDVPKRAVCAATAKNGGYLTPSDWVKP